MRFDAYARRHPVTESSYINSLAIRPYRSTIKTLPATLPEPWTVVRGQRSKHIGPWSTGLEPRIVDSVSRLKLRSSRLVDAGPGLLRRIAGSGSNWAEGWGRMLGGACGSDRGRVMERWKTKLPFFIYLPHLVLQVGVDVTYGVTSCAAPS